MRVEYINPFVETSFRVLQEVLGGADVKRGDLYLKSTAMPVMGVAALVGNKMYGILNGINMNHYDPSLDKRIIQNFIRAKLRRLFNKKDLIGNINIH